MKKYKTVLVVGLIMIVGIIVVLSITKDKVAERIPYAIDNKFVLGDIILDTNQIILPEIIVPKDEAFWFYRFYGKKSYGTFYNDLYNLTFQDFGDSLDIQFEIYEEGLQDFVNASIWDKFRMVNYLIIGIALLVGIMLGMWLDIKVLRHAA